MEEITKCSSIKNRLIPGLPDEIALECLVRVPYRSHSRMKWVCHAWRNLISHSSFYQERRKSGAAEQLICLVQPLLPSPDHDQALNINNIETATSRKQEQQNHCSPSQHALSIYNATHNTWQRTRGPGVEGGNGMIIPMFCQCLALPTSGKLLLLGGWDPTTLEPVPHAYILDFTTGAAPKWKRGAPMSVPRSFFACAVVGPSTVFVAGGHDANKNALRSAEMYDVDRDEWRRLPDMIEERDECQGLAWEGDSRFWVVSGYGSESQGQFRSDAECYDPDTGNWSKIAQVWPFSSTSPRGVTTTACVNGNQNQFQWWWLLGAHQHHLQHGSGFRKNDNNIGWDIVTSIPLPDYIVGPISCANVNASTKNKHQLFVTSGSSSSEASSPASGEGCSILEISNSGTSKWSWSRSRIHTPIGFSSFPYSASYLII